MFRTPVERRRRGALLLTLQLLLATLIVGPASATSHTTTDRVRALLEEQADNTGTVGLYLREVGAAVPLASHNATFVYEPASSLKALPHFVMMRLVQQGSSIGGEPITLDREFPWLADAGKFEGAVYSPGGSDCPTDNDVDQTDPLATLLGWMMWQSDNATTEAIRQLLWPGDIQLTATQLAVQATASTLGMTNTRWRHVMGCGWSDPGDSNQLTLVDISTLYERVATGYLDADTRETAFSLMRTVNFDTVVAQEAGTLGLPAAVVDEFWSGLASATKSGFYPIGGKYYESTGGWASVPRKNAITCVPDDREYVYGAFIHAADVNPGALPRDELLRDVIREGLESYAACTADLVHVELQPVDPPATIDVNTPTPITLRHTVRNLGPGTVDVRVATELVGTTACAVTLPPDTFVQELAPDGTVDRDVTATVTCTQPGQYAPTFRGRVSPFLATVVDPNLANNTSTRQVSFSVVARADLAVVDHDLAELDAAGLGDFLVGSSTWFDAAATITNNGDTVVPGLYTDPVDAWVDRSIEIPDGLTASVEVTDDEAPASITLAPAGETPETLADQPAGTVAEVTGPATITVRSPQSQLAIDEQREVATRFALGCDAPGDHEVRLDVRVSPQSAFVVDPVEDNDVISDERTITCVTPVQPNIRPGNTHNQVTPASQQAVPVAVLTTDAGEYGLPLAFDATTIDPASVRFGTIGVLGTGGGAEPVTTSGSIRDSFELDDHTRDGDLDRVLNLRPMGLTGIEASTTEACVTGRYLDAGTWYVFVGCDRVTTLPSTVPPSSS